jgi:ElaB/YqjD/DUF883 family membrane-anchored ribosome-binding protein
MAQTSKPKASIGDVEQQIETIRDDILKLKELLIEVGDEKISETGEAVRGEIEELLARAQKLADSTNKKTKEASGTVEDYIEKKPFQSAMIALLVGFFFGSMSRR